MQFGSAQLLAKPFRLVGMVQKKCHPEHLNQSNGTQVCNIKGWLIWLNMFIRQFLHQKKVVIR